MKDWKKILPALTAILFGFLSLVSEGQDSTLKFSDWDRNNDQLISRSEFMELFTKEYLKDWDEKNLTREDFHTVTFNIWDLDKDEWLTPDEWMFGFNNYYGVYVEKDFGLIDIDKDGYLEFAEYKEAMKNSGFFPVWDVDKDTTLSQNEMARFVFNAWDVDGSNFIDTDEYRAYRSYFLEF